MLKKQSKTMPLYVGPRENNFVDNPSENQVDSSKIDWERALGFHEPEPEFVPQVEDDQVLLSINGAYMAFDKNYLEPEQRPNHQFLNISYNTVDFMFGGNIDESIE